jgi:hypothetical protein
MYKIYIVYVHETVCDCVSVYTLCVRYVVLTHLTMGALCPILSQLKAKFLTIQCFIEERKKGDKSMKVVK